MNTERAEAEAKIPAQAPPETTSPADFGPVACVYDAMGDRQ